MCWDVGRPDADTGGGISVAQLRADAAAEQKGAAKGREKKRISIPAYPGVQVSSAATRDPDSVGDHATGQL